MRKGQSQQNVFVPYMLEKQKFYVLVLVKSGTTVMKVNNYITLETILGINGKVEKTYLMIQEFHS